MPAKTSNQATEEKSTKSSPTKSPTKPRTKKVYPKRDTKIVAPDDKRLMPQSTKRKSKPVELFGQEEVEEKEEKEVVIPKGKGKHLEACENVAREINNRKRSDELLKTVHQLCFHGRINKKTAIKDNLLAFNGLVYEDDKGRDKLEAKIERLTVRAIKEVCAFFGQDPEGGREELVPRLADFLEKPKSSDHTYSAGSVGKKRSRSSSKSGSRSSSKSPKKRSKKDPNAPKRAYTAFLYFSNENRESLQKKYPDEKITDIAKRLGEKWRKMGATDKKKFESKAEKDKERYAKEMKAYSKKK